VVATDRQFAQYLPAERPPRLAPDFQFEQDFGPSEVVINLLQAPAMLVHHHYGTVAARRLTVPRYFSAGFYLSASWLRHSVATAAVFIKTYGHSIGVVLSEVFAVLAIGDGCPWAVRI
jgi:hypothetical protein